jgi:hypothetical protein
MAERLTKTDELRDYTRLQLRAGILTGAALRADVLGAVRDEIPGHDDPAALVERWLDEAAAELAAEELDWPPLTDHDRLEAAFADLESAGVVVLRACDDHWAANAELARLTDKGRTPAGIAWVTPPDVWHAIDNGMLEINVWHGDTANVAPGDALLDSVIGALSRHGLTGNFDEGRIEVAASWQRRLADPAP